MRASLGLGIAGGIITFLVGGFEFVFGTFTVAFCIALGVFIGYLTAVSFVAGTMGHSRCSDWQQKRCSNQ